MTSWIRHHCEPNRLYLAWQAADPLNVRFRWAVAEVCKSTDGAELRYFYDDDFKAFNQGKSLDEAKQLGYQGFPAFNPRRKVHSDGVVEALMRRLPPRHRADFAAYTKQFRLPSDTPLSDFALLGATEAKLPSDGFSVVDPLDPANSDCDLFIEVAGYRHYANSITIPLVVGKPVEISAEPLNPFDPQAVVVKYGGDTIGYINRLQAPTFNQWLSRDCILAQLERLNGSADKPRAFIFVTVQPRRVQA